MFVSLSEKAASETIQLKSNDCVYALEVGQRLLFWLVLGDMSQTHQRNEDGAVVTTPIPNLHRTFNGAPLKDFSFVGRDNSNDDVLEVLALYFL